MGQVVAVGGADRIGDLGGGIETRVYAVWWCGCVRTGRESKGGSVRGRSEGGAGGPGRGMQGVASGRAPVAGCARAL